jgi:regulator of protease activity HflC (stomatin/prohibitin superfamily)
MWESIGNIFTTFGSIFPRIMYVKPYELGIKFTWGRKVTIVNPGWCFYWPIATQVDIIPVVRQIINLPFQTLTTKDHKSIIISGVLIYKIADIKKYTLSNYDTIESITEIARSAIKDITIQNDLNTLLEAEIDIDYTQKNLINMGIEVESIKITDIALTRVINLVNTQTLSLQADTVS